MKKYLFISTFFISSLGFSATNSTRSISVTGNCVRNAVPDRGSISLTTEVKEQDLKEAAKKASENYEKLKTAIAKLNLPHVEIQTTETSYRENREWEKSKMVFKGYIARMGLSVSTSAIARLGEVVAIAGNQRINDVGQLNTYMSDEKTKQEQMACLEIAADNAKKRAEKLAGALNAKVAEVLKINENMSLSPSPVYPRYEMAMAKSVGGAESDMTAPNIEAGTQKVSVTVNVEFALR